MKEKLSAFYAKDSTQKVVASLLSILIGLVVGSLVILIVGLTSKSISTKGAWEGIRLIFAGIFSTGRDATGVLSWGFNPTSVGNMLFRATPLIMTGLSIAVAYKTGLFNIGAPGQYLMGTMVSLMLALSLPTETMGAFLVWLIAFLGGMLAGALWGRSRPAQGIPEYKRGSRLHYDELGRGKPRHMAFDISNFQEHGRGHEVRLYHKTTYNGVATAKLGLDKLFPGSQVNAGILVAVLFAIVMYILINKTTLGYQLKACGSNRHAARYAGIKDKRNIVLSMAIAGSMAGGGCAILPLRQHGVFLEHLSVPARDGLQRHPRCAARGQ